MATKIQLRRDTAANWASVNPILAQGEQGLETDTGKVKVGDGVTAWNTRPYDTRGITPGAIGAATAAQGAKADTAVQPAGLNTALATKADLVGGLVPSVQLPGFVDDVLEFANVAAFPATGESGKLYLSLATNRQYRWSGSIYVEINPSPGSTDAVPEGSVNLYFTSARGQAAAGDWWAGSAAKTKLDGIAVGATANATDAQLRDRSTHTGTQPAITITGLSTVATSGAYGDLSGRPDLSLKADLVNGLVPSSQLPGFVDDVLEFANLAAFPVTGEAGKLYIALNTNKQYRWAGSTYQEINPSPGSTDAIPEGSVNLYHTTLRAAAAAPVQSVAGKTGTVTLAKGDVGLGNADNTSDADKPVSTATATALGGKAGTGAIGSSGLTMATARLLGRTTAGAGAVEEIQVSGGTFANQVLTLSGLPSTLTADTSGNLTFTARWIQSANGAASAPPMSLTGTWFTGGTSTTTKPQLLIEPAGTTSTNWSTAGTGLAVNAASGFGGDLAWLGVNGTGLFGVNSTGRVSVPLGTAALPSLYPGTDTNTGSWSPAADTLAWSTAGAERLRIDSSGRIGIGVTPSFSTMLAIACPAPGLSGDTCDFNAVSTATNSYRLFTIGLRVTGETSEALNGRAAINFILNPGNGGSDSEIGFVTNKYGASRAERLRITSTGNIGINTTTPTTLLDLNGDTIRLRTARTPASVTDTGSAGDHCWDANYIYICTATNTWKRAAITTW